MLWTIKAAQRLSRDSRWDKPQLFSAVCLATDGSVRRARRRACTAWRSHLYHVLDPGVAPVEPGLRLHDFVEAWARPCKPLSRFYAASCRAASPHTLQYDVACGACRGEEGHAPIAAPRVSPLLATLAAQ